MSIRLTFASAAVLATIAAAGHAQSVADQVVSQLTEQGYTRIEVKTGPTQLKVEAIRGGRELEAVYDLATGAILKQEVNAIGADDDTTPGVEIDARDRDFVDAAGNVHDDDDDDGNRGLGIDRDDDDDHGRGRDDDMDDDDDDDDGASAGDDDDDDDDRGRGSDDRASDDDDDDDRASDDDDDDRASDNDDDDDDSGRGRGQGRGGRDGSDDD